MAPDDNSGARPVGPVVLRIKLRYDDVETMVQRFAPNVGKNGLFLPTKSIQPIGTEVKFELRLSSDTAVLVGLGRVKHVKPQDPAAPKNAFGMAIELMRVSREGRELIIKMLDRRRAMGLPDVAIPVPEDVDAARRTEAGSQPRGDTSGIVREVMPNFASAPVAEAVLSQPPPGTGPIGVAKPAAPPEAAKPAPAPETAARATEPAESKAAASEPATAAEPAAGGNVDASEGAKAERAIAEASDRGSADATGSTPPPSERPKRDSVAPLLTSPRDSQPIPTATIDTSSGRRAVISLAPERAKPARMRVADLIAKAGELSGPVAAPHADGLDDNVDVGRALARARALAGSDLEAELAALREVAAAPLEISIEAASAELARQLGGKPIAKRPASAKWVAPPAVEMRTFIDPPARPVVETPAAIVETRTETPATTVETRAETPATIVETRSADDGTSRTVDSDNVAARKLADALGSDVAAARADIDDAGVPAAPASASDGTGAALAAPTPHTSTPEADNAAVRKVTEMLGGGAAPAHDAVETRGSDNTRGSDDASARNAIDTRGSDDASVRDAEPVTAVSPALEPSEPAAAESAAAEPVSAEPVVEAPARPERLSAARERVARGRKTRKAPEPPPAESLEDPPTVIPEGDADVPVRDPHAAFEAKTRAQTEASPSSVLAAISAIPTEPSVPGIEEAVAAPVAEASVVEAPAEAAVADEPEYGFEEKTRIPTGDDIMESLKAHERRSFSNIDEESLRTEPGQRPSSSLLIDDSADAAMLARAIEGSQPAMRLSDADIEPLDDGEHTQIGQMPAAHAFADHGYPTHADELAAELDRQLAAAEAEAEGDFRELDTPQPAYQISPYANEGYVDERQFAEAAPASYAAPAEEPGEEISDFDVLAEADEADADLLAAHGEADVAQVAQVEDSMPVRPSQDDFAARLDLGDDDPASEFDERVPPRGAPFAARAERFDEANGFVHNKPTTPASLRYAPAAHTEDLEDALAALDVDLEESAVEQQRTKRAPTNQPRPLPGLPVHRPDETGQTVAAKPRQTSAAARPAPASSRPVKGGTVPPPVPSGARKTHTTPPPMPVRTPPKRATTDDGVLIDFDDDE